jgi:hypothetical protein
MTRFLAATAMSFVGTCLLLIASVPQGTLHI